MTHVEKTRAALALIGLTQKTKDLLLQFAGTLDYLEAQIAELQAGQEPVLEGIGYTITQRGGGWFTVEVDADLLKEGEEGVYQVQGQERLEELLVALKLGGSS